MLGGNVNLQKLTKEKLIQAIHELQRTSHNESVACSSKDSLNFKKLNKKINDLESRIEDTEYKLYEAEAKINKLNQYSRRENLEIIGIPDTISQPELETTVIKLMDSMGVVLSSYEIVSCHRLYKNKKQSSANTIVRFMSRKKAIEILQKKKNLAQSPYVEIFENDIYITENLTPENRDIYDSCHLLKKKNVINNVWSYNGVVRIKFKDDNKEKPTKLYHMDDIFYYIPKAERYLQ